MSAILAAYLRNVVKFKNPVTPWWSKWWWAVCVVATVPVVLFILSRYRRQVAALRAQVVSAQAQVVQASRIAQAEVDQQRAAEHVLYVEELTAEAEALIAQQQQREAQYREAMNAVYAIEDDWQTLKEKYDALD